MAQSKLSTELKTELKKPKMYVVIMHNDDYTTMQFVVQILMQIFNKSAEDASTLMMKIHTTGSAIVGKYTYDIAVTKKLLTEQMAEKEGFPLKMTIDEE